MSKVIYESYIYEREYQNISRNFSREFENSNKLFHLFTKRNIMNFPHNAKWRTMCVHHVIYTPVCFYCNQDNICEMNTEK